MEIKQPPDAHATKEKPRWQDTNPLQKGLCAQGGCLGMQILHISVLKEPLMLVLLPHATGSERLCRAWVTSCDLHGKSSTRQILPLLTGQGWSCPYCVPPLRKLAGLARAPGFTAPQKTPVVLRGDSHTAIPGEIHHSPLGAPHCSSLPWHDLGTALTWRGGS